MLFKSLTPRLLEKLGLFVRSESGMTLPLLAVSLVALTGFTGIAIDMGRMQMLQSKLQFSLDAAGLAAGSTVSTTTLNSETAKYLNANFNGYMGATLTGSSVVANSTNTTFTLSATATLPTTFMGVVGVNTITVTANSQIARAITGLELVLVLDNTGSMGDSAGGSVTKIKALQTAATTLVNTLFGGSTTSTNGKLWVGIVPFSQAVNIGTSHPAWIGNKDATLNSDWTGCIDARQKGYDITDEPPSTGSPYTLFNLRSYTQCVTKSGATTCTKVASCTPSSSYYSTTTCAATGPYAFASPLESSNNASYGQDPYCPLQMTPLTNTSTTLLSSINKMTATGGTIIPQGMVWAWHMLSPRWQGQWGGLMDANSLPLAYGTKGMAKAVVLVTDGENTMYNTDQGSYWLAENKWTGASDITTAQNNLDTKTQAICTAMKADGIFIYTIGLGTDGGINTTLLTNCATSVNYAFTSPTTSELAGIFGTIGDSLSNLRVSQ